MVSRTVVIYINIFMNTLLKLIKQTVTVNEKKCLLK